MGDCASKSSDSIDRDWLESEFDGLNVIHSKKVIVAASQLQSHFKSRDEFLLALKNESIRNQLTELEIGDEIIKVIVKSGKTIKSEKEEERMR